MILNKTAKNLLNNSYISTFTLHYRCKKLIAFTLAEVLITLLIIGIVASLVIPTLINETNKAENITKLQKEYAILQQAYKLLIIDAGGSILNNPHFNCSGTCNATVSADAMNDFATKLNIAKNCGTGMGCFYTSSRRFLGGGIADSSLDASGAWYNNFGKAILADGSSMMVYIFSSNCTTNPSTTPVDSPLYRSICGQIQIDINGKTGPNQLGRDFFLFHITRTGLYPIGTYNDNNSCEINSSAFGTSAGCAGKIITEGGINY